MGCSSSAPNAGVDGSGHPHRSAHSDEIEPVQGVKRLKVSADDSDADAAAGLSGHTAGVYGVSVSPCSTVLLTCGDDRTLRVWSRASSRGRASAVSESGAHAGRTRSIDVPAEPPRSSTPTVTPAGSPLPSFECSLTVDAGSKLNRCEFVQLTPAVVPTSPLGASRLPVPAAGTGLWPPGATAAADPAGEGAAGSATAPPSFPPIVTASDSGIIQLWQLDHDGASYTLTPVAKFCGPSSWVMSAAVLPVSSTDVRAPTRDRHPPGLAWSDATNAALTPSDAPPSAGDAPVPPVHDVPRSPAASPAGSPEAPLGIQVSPTRHIAGLRIVAGGGDACLNLWQWDGRCAFMRLASRVVASQGGWVTDIVRVWGVDDYVATGSWEGTCHIWNVVTGREAAVMRGHHSGVMCLCALPPVSRTISHATSRLQPLVARPVLPSTPMTPDEELVGSTPAPSDAPATPGTITPSAVGGGGTSPPSLVDARGPSPGPRRTPDSHYRHQNDSTADPDLSALENPDLSALPTGLLLVSGAEDGSIRLWERSGKCLGVLSDHADSVTALRACSNGRWLLSSSKDGTVRLWSTARKQCVRVFEVPGKPCILSLAVFPDNSAVACGTVSGSVYVFPLNLGDLGA